MIQQVAVPLVVYHLAYNSIELQNYRNSGKTKGNSDDSIISQESENRHNKRTSSHCKKSSSNTSTRYYRGHSNDSNHRSGGHNTNEVERECSYGGNDRPPQEQFGGNNDGCDSSPYGGNPRAATSNSTSPGSPVLSVIGDGSVSLPSQSESVLDSNHQFEFDLHDKDDGQKKNNKNTKEDK